MSALVCRRTTGVSGVRHRFDDLEDWAEAESWPDEGWPDATDAEGWADQGPADVLREALHEAYADADGEAYNDALEAVLDGMSAAEAFNFTKALQQISSGASQALANPVVAQVARAGLPIAAGALGTVIGGPVGTAIGSQLGTLAAGALLGPGQPARGAGAPAAAGGVPPGPPTFAPGVPAAPGMPTVPGVPAAPGGPAAGVAGPAVAPGMAPPAVAGGSAAAAQGLVLTQQPDVLKALLALAMGQHGARQVGGVPVASVMNMLSSVFGQAAADADELAYLDGEGTEEGGLGEGRAEYADPALGSGRSLYTTLMDTENEELAS
jgi:hypothetical protein